jgi:hypothetical protein
MNSICKHLLEAPEPLEAQMLPPLSNPDDSHCWPLSTLNLLPICLIFSRGKNATSLEMSYIYKSVKEI